MGLITTKTIFEFIDKLRQKKIWFFDDHWLHETYMYLKKMCFIWFIMEEINELGPQYSPSTNPGNSGSSIEMFTTSTTFTIQK